MHMMLKIAYHNQEKGLPDFKDTRIILPSPPSSPIYYYPIIYGILLSYYIWNTEFYSRTV